MLCIRSWLALLMSTPRIQSVNADEHCHLEPTPGLVRVERHALSCQNTASFGFLCFSRESVNPRGICPTFSFSLRSRQMAENVADNGRAASPLPPRGDYGDEQAGRPARSTVRSTLNRPVYRCLLQQTEALETSLWYIKCSTISIEGAVTAHKPKEGMCCYQTIF